MKKKLLSVLLVLIFVLSLIPAVFAYYEGESGFVYCSHSSTPGYCYVYDQPSSVKGKNLGRMNNFDPVTIYERVETGSSAWYYISGYNTKGEYIYGYAHDYAISYDEDRRPVSDKLVISCYHSSTSGYCYVYDQPSSVKGNNLGKMSNGKEVTYLGLSDGWYHIAGYTDKGNYVYGYIHDWAAEPVY